MKRTVIAVLVLAAIALATWRKPVVPEAEAASKRPKAVWAPGVSVLEGGFDGFPEPKRYFGPGGGQTDAFIVGIDTEKK